MGIVHREPEHLILPDVDAVSSLGRALHGKDALCPSSVTADDPALLDNDYPGSLLGSRGSRGQPGAACAHHHNAGIDPRHQDLSAEAGEQRQGIVMKDLLLLILGYLVGVHDHRFLICALVGGSERPVGSID